MCARCRLVDVGEVGSTVEGTVPIRGAPGVEVSCDGGGDGDACACPECVKTDLVADSPGLVTKREGPNQA
jgi:hypothetical protein